MPTPMAKEFEADLSYQRPRGANNISSLEIWQLSCSFFCSRAFPRPVVFIPPRPGCWCTRSFTFNGPEKSVKRWWRSISPELTIVFLRIRGLKDWIFRTYFIYQPWSLHDEDGPRSGLGDGARSGGVGKGDREGLQGRRGLEWRAVAWGQATGQHWLTPVCFAWHDVFFAAFGGGFVCSFAALLLLAVFNMLFAAFTSGLPIVLIWFYQEYRIGNL